MSTFSFAQNGEDLVTLIEVNNGTFLVSGAATTTFGFKANTALTISQAELSFAAASDAAGLTATLAKGLAASGDVVFTLTSTGASTLVLGTSLLTPTMLQATSGFDVYVPAGADLGLKIGSSAANAPINGLHCAVRGTRYEK